MRVRFVGGWIVVFLLLSLPVRAACLSESAWFDRPDVFDSSEAADPLDECAFYQRAWAAFLHVTRPDAEGRPAFLGFTSYRALFQEQVLRRTPPPRPAAGGLEIDGGIDQALSAPVIDGNGNPLFYSIALDPMFTDFVRSYRLNRVEKLMDARLQPDFPDGAMELKAAWQVVPPGTTPGGQFLVTGTSIPHVHVADGQLVLDDGPGTPGEVAMLGLHVVFRIANHPEMIWATFEHVDDAGEPDLAPRAAALPDSPGAPDPTVPVSQSRHYRLYTAGASYEASNQAVWPIPEAPAARAAAPSSIYRAYPFGQVSGPDTGDALTEDPDLATLNADVARRFTADDVRRHYRLVGAVWLRDGAQAFKVGETVEPEALAGERALSNVALESLTQVGAPNCFSCHAPVGEGELPARSINVSRVFSKFADGH